MPIKESLLEILACPKCKSSVRLSNDKLSIVCDSCKLVYEIKDDIPIMLIDEANQVDSTDEI